MLTRERDDIFFFLPSLFSRLSVEDLEHLNEDGELWFAYEGLKKATR